ncbi:MAG TPA: hypothetical protein VG826_00920 [Pirellulales bacterium]|nr:hypothetical protein [Pirellulales bacterium]
MFRPRLSIHLLVVTWLINACVASADPPTVSRLKPPRITLIGAARAEFGGQRLISLTLEVSNPNDVSLTYTGYTPNSFDPPLEAGHIAPIYQIEVKRDGQWQSDPKGFCGTGLGDIDLAPRSSATFGVVVPADDWQAFKLSMGQYPGWSNEEGATTTIWSTEITRNAVDAFVNQAVPERILPFGKWKVEFANGVVETCEVHADGLAGVVEPQRNSRGKASVQDDSVVIHFDDDRLERWTTVGARQVVEHWFPASLFSTGTPVLGIAERCD